MTETKHIRRSQFCVSNIQTQCATPLQNDETFMLHATRSKTMWNIAILALLVTCSVHCISTGVIKWEWVR